PRDPVQKGQGRRSLAATAGDYGQAEADGERGEDAHLQSAGRRVRLSVTAQVLLPCQERRRDFARIWGSSVRASRIFQPCFLAVAMNERRTAKSVAPSSERKPPEIFCRSFIMRPSRSASLLVNGTVGSCRKRSVSSRRVTNLNSRLCPARRGARPRRLPCPFSASGGCASWKASPSATIAS